MNKWKYLLSLVFAFCLAISFTACKKIMGEPKEFIRYKVNNKSYEVLETNTYTYFKKNHNIYCSKSKEYFSFDWSDKDLQSFEINFDLRPNPIVEKNFYEWNGGSGVIKKMSVLMKIMFQLNAVHL